jgi:hypothetical protein
MTSPFGLIAAYAAIAIAVGSFQFLTLLRHSPKAPPILRNSWLDSLVMLWTGTTIPLSIATFVMQLRESGMDEFAAFAIASIVLVFAAWANDAVFKFRGRLRAMDEIAKKTAGAP